MFEAIDVRDGTPAALIDVLVFGSLADEPPSGTSAASAPTGAGS